MARTLKMPFTVEDIKEVLPHRDPFLMIDEVTEFDDAVYMIARKHVRAEEPHFAGHFPGRPIMPGVLILEAMAQAGALFAKLSTGGVDAGKLILFAGADEVRFRKPVFPGDILSFKMYGHKRRGPFWRMKGEAYVDGALVAEATIMANEVE